MQLTAISLLIGCLHVLATGNAQKISLSVKNESLKTVFSEVRKQSGVQFLFVNEIIDKAKKVTIQVKDASLQEVLDICFRDQPLTYTIKDNVVLVKAVVELKPNAISLPPKIISGMVVNEAGDPLSASIVVKGSNKGVSSEVNGKFTLNDILDNAVLIISSVGYESQEYKVLSESLVTIVLQSSKKVLDEVQFIAYGTTTKRLSTGNITSIKAEEIEKQPVSNPLALLQGRVPGLVVTQSSGIPGAAFSVQVRGQSSLLQGSNPLFVVDGVPFESGNNQLNQLFNAADAGLSPLNLISPSSIESIEILKDADATAIYGSRGANGVILITTKKGKANISSLSINYYSGFNKAPERMKMMNTSQYVAMRKEAFANDGVAMTTDNAPDILLWDTTRYTDLRKLLTGGTGRTQDGQINYSGGSNHTRFLIGGAFHSESSVFNSDLRDQRSSALFNLNHSSIDKRFSLILSTNFSFNHNRISEADLTRSIILPPNILLRNSEGGLNWTENGAGLYNMGLKNPLSAFNVQFNGKYTNLNTNLQIAYKINSRLSLRLSSGYNQVNGNENKSSPSTSFDPASGELPDAYFASQNRTSWIIEPQATYNLSLKKSSVDILAGITFQSSQNSGRIVEAYNYPSDILLGSLAGASDYLSYDNFTQYRYQAGFGRVRYSYADKYLATLSFRRDGSSRFGSGNQFNNFGALGTAWIISDESFFRNLSRTISFAKVRMSYGHVGNDQIGDYKYLDTWTAGYFTYMGSSILEPFNLFNPDYSWEINKKAETGIELGLLDDKLLMSISYYRNTSSNQLIDYTLPIQTGFPSVNTNFDANIRNSGWEFQISGKPIREKISWSTNFNLTISKNKLISFPGIEESSYANTYYIGESVRTRKVYEYLGVDPSEGIYNVKDVNNDGQFGIPDYNVFINTDPKFYGGWLNSFQYKSFSLDVFIEFRKQNGYNILKSFLVAGFRYSNAPEALLDRWQKPGQSAPVQKYTANVTPALIHGYGYMGFSNGVISDASFLRLKSVSLAYNFPAKWLSRVHAKAASLFLRGQNLATLTSYWGDDPETQNIQVLSPLRNITVGLSLNF